MAFQGPHWDRKRLFIVVSFSIVVLVCVAVVVFALLSTLHVFNVLVFLHLESASDFVIDVPTCNDVYFPVRLVYDPSSQSVQDVSGHACTVVVPGSTEITASGTDPVIGPYWSGTYAVAFDVMGCTSYTWTQWMQLQDAVMLNQRIMTMYSTADPTTGPFPLTAFLTGCGLAVLGTHTYAIAPNAWVHVGIVYDATSSTNTWYVNGVQVFHYAAYTDPPPVSYLSATMTLSTTGSVLLGETHVYCKAFAETDVVADAQLVAVSFPPLTPPYPSASVPNPGPLPAVQYQGSTSTSDISAFHCIFPTPQSEAAIPSSAPSSYTTFYVDQQQGSDAALGTGVAPNAWATLTNVAIFGNIAYDFGITSTKYPFQSGVTPSGSLNYVQFTVPPLVAVNSGVFPNSCNAWHFVNANTGHQNSFTVGETQEVRNGVANGSSPDGSSSMWLSVSSVTGKVSLPPSGGYSQGPTVVTFITPSSGGGFSYTFGSRSNTLSTLLQYNAPYFVTQVWYCSAPPQYMQLWVNGAMVSNLTSGITNCPSIAPGIVSPFMSSDGAGNTFTGYLGAMTMHYVALPNSAVMALHRLMSTSVCAISNICFALKICQGNRFFGQAQGLPLMPSADNCPLFVGSYACASATTTDQPLISGATILPQVAGLGWNPVVYTNPVTGVQVEVLEYDLLPLYEATGTAFLPSDPRVPFGRYLATSFPTLSVGLGTALPAYMPMVNNDLYLTPRAPNIDDPRYPLGNRFWHALHTLDYCYGDSSCVSDTYLQPTPGSWCNMTWNQMFQQNTTAYLQFMEHNMGAINNGVVWTMQYTYTNDHISAPTFNSVGSNVINCEEWYSLEITANTPSSTNPGEAWTDPTLALYGVSYEHSGDAGFVIPQCAPACTHFSQFSTRIDPPPYNTPPPPFTPNPLGQAAGGWQSKNSYFIQGDQFSTVFFDGPGEAYYDPESCVVRLIPWDENHRTQLLTASTVWTLQTLTAVSVALNPAATAWWARLMDRNTQLGVTVGYGGWALTTTQAGAIVQDIAISHYNGWGLVVITQQPSRVENVALSYNLNHIRVTVQTGATFVINSTAVNTTRPWYGQSVNNDGYGMLCVDMGPQATCSAIHTDIVTTVGASTINFMRGVRFVDNAGQSGLNGIDKLWIETSLFNITEVFVGDAGVIYNDPQPTTFLWTTFDNTVYSQAQNLDPQTAFLYGTSKAGYPRAAGYWTGSSIVWHGCQFLSIQQDVVGLTGAPTSMSYNVDSFAQMTSMLITGSSFTFTVPGQGQTLPVTRQGAVGRPWGFQNCYAILDDVQYNPIAVAYDYPVFGPGFQGASMLWRWGTGVSAWVSDFQMCYGPVDYTGTGTQMSISAAELSLSSEYSGVVVPGPMNKPLANAVGDWAMAVANGSPPPQFGLTQCQTLRDTVQQQLANEAAMHTAATQPGMLAAIHSQMSFWTPALATKLFEAANWEEPMSRYNPSGPPWSHEPDSTYCSSVATCDPDFLLTHIVPVLSSGSWVDGQGQASVSFSSFNGHGAYQPLNPQYTGASYDTDMGAVIDTSFSQGLIYALSFPRTFTQFTVMFWLYVPTFKSGSVINFNRYTPVFLQFTSLGAATVLQGDGQGQTGVSGGATPSLTNAGAGCCPFNRVPITTGGACPVQRTGLMDTWVHFAMAVSSAYQYTALYQNGQRVFNCAGFGIASNNIQPVWGGSTSMPFNGYFSGKMSGFRVYAGKMSDSTVQSMYQTFKPQYAGPASFPVISGTSNQVLQIQYNATVNTFVISPTETVYTLATMGQFSSAFLVSDPTGQVHTPVLSSLAQFSFPTPAGLSAWTMTIQVLWIATPNSMPWFYIPYSSASDPGKSQLMVLLGGTDGDVCLYANVSQTALLNSSTPVVGQKNCAGGVAFPLGAWTTYKFTFNSATGQAYIYVNGGAAIAFPAVVGVSLSTQRSLLFQIPTQYWLYAQSKLTSPINIGYINSIALYSAVV